MLPLYRINRTASARINQQSMGNDGRNNGVGVDIYSTAGYYTNHIEMLFPTHPSFSMIVLCFFIFIYSNFNRLLVFLATE